MCGEARVLREGEAVVQARRALQPRLSTLAASTPRRQATPTFVIGAGDLLKNCWAHRTTPALIALWGLTLTCSPSQQHACMEDRRLHPPS